MIFKTEPHVSRQGSKEVQGFIFTVWLNETNKRSWSYFFQHMNDAAEFQQKLESSNTDNPDDIFTAREVV